MSSDSSDAQRLDDYDLVILGAGSAGLTVASVASQLGALVALVEADHMGGDCLNYGCVPSKSLLRCAHAAQAVRDAGRFGVSADAPSIDYTRVRDYVSGRIAAIAPHDSAERFRSLGCHVFLGRAAFVDSHTVSVALQSGIDAFYLKGKRFVIATGSTPRVPSLPGLAEVGFLTNLTVFSHDRLPASLVVLGGGPIGVEMAQAFRFLGSEVTLLQSADRILPRDDEEAARRLQRILESQGVAIQTNAKAVSVRKEGSVKIVTFEKDGATNEARGEEILVAVGRTPSTDLNLAAAGVAFGPNGVQVDARQRTTARHIFACGDVAGPFLFTHMASAQAATVIVNTVFRLPSRISYRAVPWCTFTSPELASVGLTEKQAKEQGLSFRVFRADLEETDRAICDGAEEGMVKILVGRRNRLLGAQILAPRAGEMIHEFVLAMNAGLPISAIRNATHVYPTYSDAVRKAVSAASRESLFSPRTRWVAGLLRRIFR
jgi:pyruvate/2-oxoglutarate dehydrogenase complex dihydrolipoamide dehydrogenase (E3) component